VASLISQWREFIAKLPSG